MDSDKSPSIDKTTYNLPIKFISLYLPIIMFLLGFLTNQILSNINTNNPESQEIRQGGYQLINPLLECESAPQFQNTPSLKKLEADLEKFINTTKKDYITQQVSVYFRDLNNGPWFGINESDQYIVGSLIKVPILMSYLKYAETNPSILQEKLAYEGQESLPISTPTWQLPPEQTLEINQEYSVEELLYKMIVYSDNLSMALLLTHPEITYNNALDKTLSDLDIPYTQTVEPALTTRDYAALFRILYNSSYLNKTMSEKALSIMNQTIYKQGLVAGLPDNTTVAHKYGIRNIGSNLSQVHDCGIIYFPKKPYLLCVMTKGENQQNLESVIANISQLVFNHLNTQ